MICHPAPWMNNKGARFQSKELQICHTQQISSVIRVSSMPNNFKASEYRHLTIQSSCISKLKCLDCTIEISNLGGHTDGRHPALAGMYQTH